jgi:hypothetical protein
VDRAANQVSREAKAVPEARAAECRARDVKVRAAHRAAAQEAAQEAAPAAVPQAAVVRLAALEATKANL